MSIRVALVGLSARAVTGWAAAAHLPYLLSDRGRARFRVVALLNSSEAAARAAVEHFGLPPATTAVYGDAAALAADVASGALAVDLVAVATRVDVHYESAVALLRVAASGPTTADPTPFPRLLVEWPLADSLARVRELAALAASAGVRTAVALQGRQAAVVRAVQAVLASGRIGRVLSSEVRAFGGLTHRDSLSPSLRYFADHTFGGNVYTIGLAHVIDLVQFVLGELDHAHTHAHLHRQRTHVDIRDSSDRVIDTIPTDVPDLFAIAGTILPAASPLDLPPQGAALHVHFRTGPPFPGEPALEWTVAGETGELRLVAPKGTFLQISAAVAASDVDAGAADRRSLTTLDVHDYASDQVTPVPWQWADWQAALPAVPSRGIGALYEAFVGGDASAYATFADAQERYEQLMGWWASSEVAVGNKH